MKKKVAIIATFMAALFLSQVAYAGNTLLVDDFSRSNFINQLNGTSGGDKELPGRCSPGFIWETELVFGRGGRSLKLDFDVTERDSYSFFWMKLGPNIPDQKGRTKPLDLTKQDYLSFWVRGEKAKERFKIELHQDVALDGRFDFGKDISSFVYVSAYLPRGITQKWQKVVIPLKDFKAINNWSGILELVFTFESRVGNIQSSVYIDDIVFGSAPSDVLEGKALPDFEVSFKSSIQANNRSVIDGFQFGSKNELSIKLTSGQAVPVLEGVRFEYSADFGKTWRLIGTDYNTEDAVYGVNWNTSGLAFPGNYQLRAVAVDINDRKSSSGVVKDCTIEAMATEEILELISRSAFQFFWDNQDPRTGLFRDATGRSDSNIGVCGFGLTALAIGAERGWVDKNEAKKRILKCIYTFLGDPKKPSRPRAKDKNGFYYHFINMRDAKRHGNCEISTVDTALLICGALASGEYFGGEVKKAAELLYKRAEWTKYVYVTPGANKKLCTMGWAPEKGFLNSYWDYYTDEAIIVTLLAIGSPTYPLESRVFYDWRREKGAYKDQEPFIYSWHGALFAHQYAHAWFDLYSKVDKKGVDWWRNSKIATLTNRQFTIDNAVGYKTYGPYSWGITSMDRPEGYTMEYGVAPCGSGNPIHDGTISPSGAAGSIMFTPVLSIKTLKYLYNMYPFLWGEYGFRDSYNLDRNWASGTYYGLGQGILLLSIENFRSGFVWDNFMENKFIKSTFSRAGFKRVSKPRSKPKLNVDSLIKELANTEDLNSIIDLTQKARLQCETQEDYDNLVNILVSLKEKEENFNYLAELDYFVAKTRFDQLRHMEEIDDLEQGRLYLSKVDSFYNEIEKNLVDFLASSELEELLLDGMSLLFIAYQDQFRFDDAELAFKRLVKLANELTGEESTKIGELNKITNQLTETGYADYALKLRVSSIPKLSKPSITEMIKELKSQADLLYKGGNTKDAEPIYTQYVNLISQYSPKETAASSFNDIADKFFTNGQYEIAIKFYNQGLKLFSKSSLRDYWQLNLASSYKHTGDHATAIKNYEQFLKSYADSEKLGECLRALSVLYYTKITSIDEAIFKLKSLTSRFPTVNTNDFAQLYIGLLYLQLENYEEAFKELETLLYSYPNTTLKHSTEKIIEGIERKGEEGVEPAYRRKVTQDQRLYNIGKPIEATLHPIRITTRPGSTVAFTVSTIKDLDKYSVYEKVEYEDDAYTLEWSASDGEFLTSEHGSIKQWRAPKESGQYEVRITVSDIGLVRRPDKGERDDKLDKIIVASITVRSIWPVVIPGLILLILISVAIYVFIKRKSG